jgi:hybrid cluster-associated redox disulfide protein
MPKFFQSILKNPIQGILKEKTASTGEARAALQDLKQQLSRLQNQLKNIQTQTQELAKKYEEAQLTFHSKMTVHEVWAAHPGAKQVFSEYHLPHCDQCPVGADERLEEAAFGYAIDLKTLLSKLNSLV